MNGGGDSSLMEVLSLNLLGETRGKTTISTGDMTETRTAVLSNIILAHYL